MIKGFSFGWLVAFCVWMASSAALALPPMHEFTLSNGMPVVLIENHRVPAVSHAVWYKAGAADEPPGKSGIAHFLEHLMFKGTERIPAGEFSETVARLGGRDNAFTSYDFTGYYQNIAVNRLEKVMEMEADRMRGLLIDPSHVGAERKVIIEERQQRIENRPDALLREEMRAALFRNHPYGSPSIGWQHEMEGLTREDALAFYHRIYRPANAVLIVAGDITQEELQPLAEKYYGVIEAGEAAERARPQEPPARAPRRVTLTHPNAEKSHWSRQYLAPSLHRGLEPGGEDTRHALPLVLLAHWLGGTDTSLLYRRLVVERKLATHTYAYYSDVSYDPGVFTVGALPAENVSLETLEAAMDEELTRALEEGIGAEELVRVKKLLRADTVFAQDSLDRLAQIAGDVLCAGLTLDYLRDWEKNIESVTADQIQEANRAVLQPERSVTGLLLPVPGEEEAL